MSMSGLKNNSVIVTGAASGIGRATALRFAREKAKVVAADLNDEGVKTVVEEIRAAGGAAEAVSGDLSDPAVIERVVSTAVTEFGGVDVLANIAGIIDSQSAAADVSDAEWERIIRINLTAPFMLARAVLPHMLAKRKGAIVNTGSTASLRGSASGAAYTVSKHGVIGLTQSLAVMYGGSGIRTNAIAPGPTMTNIVADYTGDEEGHGPMVLAGYRQNISRYSEADEPAAAIVFLASDAASSVNGVVLPVDNGIAAA
ncbi:SDR family NAD(P)-dependent oxidoreductase [Streptomyces capitiformicae]|uniref:3-ketoacyl-ACP reductase n=1 Tax=Streptomyces capitiformicae TaxID=2014920 RepID=A0A918Z932_9ACTN|nr:SDR family oxidoreductase [Streptomyces capitiformicae]GHE41782.1 3-ketoacyl-ACP reductase [Streptomyces capitiformicae]